MPDWLNSVVNWAGAIIGMIGLVFAVQQYRERTRVEAVIKDTLRRLAGEIKVVYSNAHWAELHSRNIGFIFAEENPDLKQIKLEAFDCARDTAACARQLGLAHSKIRGIQQSLFRDSQETLPEINSADVIEAKRG
jgi:hypothetical protein